MIQEARSKEDSAFTTDGTHTAHLLPVDPSYPFNSVRNYKMRTRVASIAYDELGDNDNPSVLAQVYQSPILTQLVSEITDQPQTLYLSADPIGCCTINVFRQGYYHSFHFDESEFSTTLMLQEAKENHSGLFQYTPLLRQSREDLALEKVASIIHQHGSGGDTPLPETTFAEEEGHAIQHDNILHTLDFHPGTLSIFSGSRSLHRVTQVKGSQSRLVAVLTYATKPGFKNSKQVQELFWGRSSK